MTKGSGGEQKRVRRSKKNKELPSIPAYSRRDEVKKITVGGNVLLGKGTR